jgi:hypothetical protein
MVRRLGTTVTALAVAFAIYANVLYILAVRLNKLIYADFAAPPRPGATPDGCVSIFGVPIRTRSCSRRRSWCWHFSRSSFSRTASAVAAFSSTTSASSAVSGSRAGAGDARLRHADWARCARPLHSALVMEDLKGKRVTVAGLGKFGGQIAAAKWLVAQGARVLVTDRTPADKLASSVKELDGLPIDFRLGEHRVDDFSSADLIVTSPASRRTTIFSPPRGRPVSDHDEIRLFIERCPTRKNRRRHGTKGKSTTTALLGPHARDEFTTHVGGNIGGRAAGAPQHQERRCRAPRAVEFHARIPARRFSGRRTSRS